jgi:predicted transcriptional regulator
VKTVVLSVRCSPRLLSRLDTLCQASLQTRADIMRWLIAKARLDDLPQSWRGLSADERELLQEIR